MVGLAMALAAAAAVGSAMAAEMWMPETGEMSLEDLPRQDAEARRLHALALIGRGQWSSGTEELRLLLAAEPDAEWAAEARFAIARGLLATGRPREAFDELERVAEEFPDSPFAARTRGYQRTAARVLAVEEPDAAGTLYDRLVVTARDADEAATILCEKADAFFRARRYLDAEAFYLELITEFPRSEHNTYAWFRAAECEWRMAQWLGLGLERMENAEKQFEDFARTYPSDLHAPEARERVADVQAARASFVWQVARFYIDAERKPWAAVVYLERLLREFPESPEAGWAEVELQRIRAGLEAPLRGTVQELALPGVATETGP